MSTARCKQCGTVVPAAGEGGGDLCASCAQASAPTVPPEPSVQYEPLASNLSIPKPQPLVLQREPISIQPITLQLSQRPEPKFEPLQAAPLPSLPGPLFEPLKAQPQPLPPLHFSAPWYGPTSSPQITSPRGWFAPKPRRDGLARRWSNGYNFITPKDRPGLSSLKVVNGTDRDAAVKMVSGTPGEKTAAGSLCRFVYVCAGKSVTIQGIGSGEYHLFFSTGRRWDQSAKRFSQSAAVQRFVDAVWLTQNYTSDGVSYSKNEVTLHPVVGGSARTTIVSQDEFDRLS